MFGQVSIVKVAEYLKTTTPSAQEGLVISLLATQYADAPLVLDMTGVNADFSFYQAFIQSLERRLRPAETQIHVNAYVRFRNISASQLYLVSEAWGRNKYRVRQD